MIDMQLKKYLYKIVQQYMKMQICKNIWTMVLHMSKEVVWFVTKDVF